MRIFPKQIKEAKGKGHFYFGDYNEIDIAISAATMPQGESDDVMHFHKKGVEYYLTLSGEAILEVEGEEIRLIPDNLVMVEPGEKHRVARVLSESFSFLAIATVKSPDDKVIVS